MQCTGGSACFMSCLGWAPDSPRFLEHGNAAWEKSPWFCQAGAVSPEPCSSAGSGVSVVSAEACSARLLLTAWSSKKHTCCVQFDKPLQCFDQYIKIKIDFNIFCVILFLYFCLSYFNTEHDRYFGIGSMEEKFIRGGFPGKVSNFKLKAYVIPLISFMYFGNHKQMMIIECGNIYWQEQAYSVLELYNVADSLKMAFSLKTVCFYGVLCFFISFL